MPPPSLPALDNLNLIDHLNRASLPCTRNKNLRSAIYITAKEVRDVILDIKNGFEDENDVTTDSSDDPELYFDNSDDDEFDLILSVHYDAADNYIDVD